MATTATPGVYGTVKFAPSTNPPTQVVGRVQSVSSPFEREKINITPVGQTSPGGEKFMLGKFVGSEVGIECVQDLSDAGQLALQTAFLGTGTGYMLLLSNPSAVAGQQGYGFTCIVHKFSPPFSKDGAVMVSIGVTIMDKVVVDNGTIPTLAP